MEGAVVVEEPGGGRVGFGRVREERHRSIIGGLGREREGRGEGGHAGKCGACVSGRAAI
jgi:hypothetical protein